MKDIPLYEVRKIKDIKDMINSSIEIYGSKPAFWVKQKGTDKYLAISYYELKKDLDALGTALIDLGLKDKRIAIIGENRYEWAVSYLAIVAGTSIVVPIDRELPKSEIESLLIRAEVDAIIFSGNNYSHISEVAKKNNAVKYYINMDGKETNYIETNNTGSDNTSSDNTGSNNFQTDNTKTRNTILAYKDLIKKGKELLNNGDAKFINAAIDAESMSILLFTSATTDKSKAVMLSQKNICINLMAMSSMVYIDPKDIFFSILPLHHTYECTCGFLCALYRGASIAYCEGLRHIQKNLQESKATVMLAVPLIFEAMYRRIWDQAKKSSADKKLKTAIKISNLLNKFGINITRKLFAPVYNNFGGNIRLFISGAAGIDPHIAKGFRDFGLIFVQGYGLTECSPIAALNRDVYCKDDAAGLPLPGLEVKIDLPNEEGVGEIKVKGENVMLGYYGDSEATEKVLKSGWFYTGDLGFIDSDGFVHITGRKKHVIVTKNGKNIYPEEIETLLNKSPYIMESMVYGKDDSEFGDVVVSAAVVPDMEKIQEDFAGKTLSQEEIHELIRKEVKQVNKKLVTYKYVKDFHLRENEFAKTTTKKIKRYMEKVE